MNFIEEGNKYDGFYRILEIGHSLDIRSGVDLHDYLLRLKQKLNSLKTHIDELDFVNLFYKEAFIQEPKVYDVLETYCSMYPRLTSEQIVNAMTELFSVQWRTANSMYYILHRGSYREGMLEELIRLDNPENFFSNDNPTYRPKVTSGVIWDAVDRRFIEVPMMEGHEERDLYGDKEDREGEEWKD